MGHDYDFDVAAKDAAGVEREAHAMAQRYFGSEDYVLAITAELATVDGNVYRARVHASSAKPYRSPSP
jgi:hypothetical protein